MFISLLVWWYGHGWQQVMQSIMPRTRNVAANFSILQLIRTLFAPWKRIITFPGRSLEEHLRAAADNAFGRAVGFVVRIFVLAAGLIVVLAVFLFSIIEVVIWPLLPLAIPGFVIAGFML
jgi:hypothetical protein